MFWMVLPFDNGIHEPQASHSCGAWSLIRLPSTVSATALLKKSSDLIMWDTESVKVADLVSVYEG